MRVVYEDVYFHAALSDEGTLLRVTRRPHPFPSVDEAQKVFHRMAADVGKLPIDRVSLLFDVREGPGRNDAAFESMVSETRALLFGGFARRAILLATMAGVLQTKRLEREAGGTHHMEPFTDEAQALAYLRSSQ